MAGEISGGLPNSNDDDNDAVPPVGADPLNGQPTYKDETTELDKVRKEAGAAIDAQIAREKWSRGQIGGFGGSVLIVAGWAFEFATKPASIMLKPIRDRLANRDDERKRANTQK